MQIWHFTEEPYPYLPPSDSFESIRVTLPNGVYDPKIGADLYHRYIDDWMVADEEGINVMVNEHHQTPTCLASASPLILAILARVTRQARLLVLGNPIANRLQPVRIAEEMAMVDVISRGRLECGFVKGVPYEVACSSLNPVRMTERMWEAHDLIVKAWTTHDGPFSWEGRFFNHRTVNVWPRPYQQPHPPIWVATTSAQGAATVGEKGYVAGTFLTGYKETPAVFAGYREGWLRAGRARSVPLDRLAYCALVYVGRTEAEAREGGRNLLWYLTNNKTPMHYRNPPGYASLAANVRALRANVRGYQRVGKFVTSDEDAAQKGPMPEGPDLDEEIARGTMFCGTPDTVMAQIERFYDHVGGFGHLLSHGHAGTAPRDETISSIRLLAREVRPRLMELMRRRAAA